MKLHFFSDYSIIIRSMKKVKHILVIFLHSFIPSDIYYPKLLHVSFSYSLKYFFVVLSFFTILFTGIVLYMYSPSKLISYKNSVIDSLSQFPDNVHFAIHNKMLESNLDKPFFLWVQYNSQPFFLIMAHTKDSSIRHSRIPLPLIFLGTEKAHFIYRHNRYTYSYPQSLHISVTKNVVESFISTLNSSFPSFLIFFYIFLFVIVPLLFILYITSFILLSSILVFLLLRTFIPHIHLKKCIQAGMHGTHIPIFGAILLFSFCPFATNILPLVALLIVMFTLVSTYEMYSKEFPLYERPIKM